MANKKIVLLVEDDVKTREAIQEILGKEYQLETVKDREDARAYLGKATPDIILIDFDLKKEDGLQVFKEIHPLKPDRAVIMLSSSGNIPLAVAATKAGVAEFLRKPLDALQLKEALARNAARFEEKLFIPEEQWWLKGESPALKKMLAEIQVVLNTNAGVVLSSEKGIDKRAIAEVIHASGPRKKRKLISLNLSGFRREALETHFWTMLNKIMSLPSASSAGEEEDLCGTIYLENFESLEEQFKAALLKFFRERRGKIDKSIRSVMGLGPVSQNKIKDYAWIQIPSLCFRKEDLPYFLPVLLAHYNLKYNKKIKSISIDLLEYLAAYNYPGNYIELQNMLKEAVLNSACESIELKDLPFNLSEFMGIMLKKSQEEKKTLNAATAAFEKKFYQVLLSKLGGDNSRAARFLDIPKTTFLQRIEDLNS